MLEINMKYKFWSFLILMSIPFMYIMRASPPWDYMNSFLYRLICVSNTWLNTMSNSQEYENI